MRRHKRRLEEEEEGRKMGGKEGKGAEKKGGTGEEECEVWRWHRLEAEDVQRVCLSELPMVGFPLYRLAL